MLSLYVMLVFFYINIDSFFINVLRYNDVSLSQMYLLFVAVSLATFIQCKDHVPDVQDHAHHALDDHDHTHHVLGDHGADLVGGMVGSAQMFGQSVAAGLALNSQWFLPAGVSCQEEASTASLQQGWPSTVLDLDTEDRLSIFYKYFRDQIRYGKPSLRRV